MELSEIIYSICVALISAGVSYLTAALKSHHEIKKMKLEWQHNYNEKIQNELGVLAEHITTYLQYPSQSVKFTICKESAALKVKATGDLAVALDNLYKACESGSISEIRKAFEDLKK